MSTDEAARLRMEIRERMDRLDELEKPRTPDDLVAMARTNPAKFNRLWDEGLIGGDQLTKPTNKEKTK